MVEVPAGDWITLADAGRLLGTSKMRAYQYAKEGRLPYRMVGNMILVTRPDVLALKVSRRKAGRPPKVKPEPPKAKRKKP